MLLDQRVDAFEHRGEAVLVDGVAEVVVEHRPPDLRGVEEVERLAVAQQLVEGLRHRREIQPRPLGCGVGEQALLGQDRLAGTGRAHHERDRVQHEPAAEHLVEPVVSGGEAFHQETGALERRVNALETQQVADRRHELQRHHRLGQERASPGRHRLIGEVSRVVEGAVGAWSDNEYFEMHVDGLTPQLQK